MGMRVRTLDRCGRVWGARELRPHRGGAEKIERARRVCLTIPILQSIKAVHMVRALQTLDLALLLGGMPGLSAAFGASLAEAASVCLRTQFHTPPTSVGLDGIRTRTLRLNWIMPTDRQERTYADLQLATEFGAYGIGIAAVHHLTKKVVVERSAKGTGFDFWLGRAQDNMLFQRKARLEVSGILRGAEGRH